MQRGRGLQACVQGTPPQEETPDVQASPESGPGDFSGNQQPAATSPAGEVLSWQAASQRHALDLAQRSLLLSSLLKGGHQDAAV